MAYFSSYLSKNIEDKEENAKENDDMNDIKLNNTYICPNKHLNKEDKLKSKFRSFQLLKSFTPNIKAKLNFSVIRTSMIDKPSSIKNRIAKTKLKDMKNDLNKKRNISLDLKNNYKDDTKLQIFTPIDKINYIHKFFKSYSKLKISPYQEFSERMSFDIYKRQLKNDSVDLILNKFELESKHNNNNAVFQRLAQDIEERKIRSNLSITKQEPTIAEYSKSPSKITLKEGFSKYTINNQSKKFNKQNIIKVNEQRKEDIHTNNNRLSKKNKSKIH